MNKLKLCDVNEDDLKVIESSEVLKKVEFDLFDYVGAPCDNVKDVTLDQYKQQLEKQARDRKKWSINYENKKKGITTDEASLNAIENEELIKEIIIKPNGVSEHEIKVVYCYIESYVENPATIKVTRPDPSVPLTNIELLAIYTRAFQWMYEEEESEVGNPGHLPGMANRAPSNGRYGVWGHDLSDLVYNGDSEVSIYKDFVYCQFEVDS